MLARFGVVEVRGARETLTHHRRPQLRPGGLCEGVVLGEREQRSDLRLPDLGPHAAQP